MAGIYIHIPFCRKACHYCNFHFSTNLSRIDELIKAAVKEIDQRATFLANQEINTIYFGGGTPSLLNEQQLGSLFTQMQKSFDLTGLEEVTLEINPEDVSENSLGLWNDLGVNRLSIGVQSFFNEDLTFMNRAHDAQCAHNAIELSKKAGFDNISIDLIFGAHTTTDEMWAKNLSFFIDYNIHHLSAYGLTVEENTALAHFIRSGKSPKLDEGKSARHFQACMEVMGRESYEHYEISNYAKPDRHSRHNANYWKGEVYLGIGPAAHSYDGSARYWNLANNEKYIHAAQANAFEPESENLSAQDKYNEFIMTGLRYFKGIAIDRVRQNFNPFLELFEAQAERHIENRNIIEQGGYIKLSQQGKLISDHIISDFFATND